MGDKLISPSLVPSLPCCCFPVLFFEVAVLLQTRLVQWPTLLILSTIEEQQCGVWGLSFLCLWLFLEWACLILSCHVSCVDTFATSDMCDSWQWVSCLTSEKAFENQSYYFFGTSSSSSSSSHCKQAFLWSQQGTPVKSFLCAIGQSFECDRLEFVEHHKCKRQLTSLLVSFIRRWRVKGCCTNGRSHSWSLLTPEISLITGVSAFCWVQKNRSFYGRNDLLRNAITLQSEIAVKGRGFLGDLRLIVMLLLQVEDLNVTPFECQQAMASSPHEAKRVKEDNKSKLGVENGDAGEKRIQHSSTCGGSNCSQTSSSELHLATFQGQSQ